MRNKKLFAGLVVLALMLSLLAACTGNNSGGNEPANTGDNQPSVENGEGNSPSDEAAPLDFQDLQLSWYVNYDWAAFDPWGSDPTTAWLQNEKNMQVEYISSGGAAQQKLNTMIVSNDLPDLITLDRGADVEKMVQAGLLVPYDDYLDKYPNLVNYFGMEAINMLRSSDGKLYQFPNWYSNDELPTANGGWLVNIKIYEELGSPSLENFTDLENYLRLVREQYPDVVPLEVDVNFAGRNVLLNGFYKDQPFDPISIAKAFVHEGELKPLFSDPTYAEYAKFVSRLFRDRLISQDAFTQTNDQVDEKFKTGRVAVFVSAGDVINRALRDHPILAETDPGNGYFPIEPLGVQGLNRSEIVTAPFTTFGWNVSVITRAAEDPEKIFAFMDWATGVEGQAVLWHGPPGLYWDEIDAEGVPVPNDNFKNVTPDELDRQKLGVINYWANTEVVDQIDRGRERYLGEPNPFMMDVERLFSIRKQASLNVNEFLNSMPASDAEEGIIYQQIEDLYQAAFAQIAFARSDADVDSILERLQRDVTNAGQERLIAYVYNNWQENLAKINANY